MNAFAALITGAGTGAPPELVANTKSGAESGDEPDFFAVLQGTIDMEESPDAQLTIQPEISEPEDVPEVFLGEEAGTGTVSDSTPAPAPEANPNALEAHWLALEGGEIPEDAIPLLESEVEGETRRTALAGSETSGDAALPALPMDAELLSATVTSGTDAVVRLAPTKPALTGSVGPSNPTLATTAPSAEAPDPAMLAGTTGEQPMAPVAAPEVIADPDLSLIDPRLRARVGRVIERMRIEYGHNVKVVEGFRTPERQAALFAQGRTAPGPVVTWTQNSMHSEGLAVDVIVDGSYAPHEGYRRLAQIAKDEGLRTLGPQDPGHLQLAPDTQESEFGGESFERIAQVQRTATVAPTATVAEPARVALSASIAEPAVVAQPAAVATPAEVAVPGSEGTPLPAEPPQLAGDRLALNSTATEAPDQAVAGMSITADGPKNEGEGELGQRERTRALARAALRRERGTSRLSQAEPLSPLRDADPRLSATVSSENGQSVIPAQSVKTPGMVSAEALHRVTQVRELQELAYPRKLGQVTLRMLDGLSEEARMRVSLMGDGVATSIGVRDLAQADRMRSRIGTLEQALRQRGLESSSVKVSAFTTPTAADVAALAGQAVSGTRLSAEAETFLNWTGQDVQSSKDDKDEPLPRRDRNPNENQQQQNEEGR